MDKDVFRIDLDRVADLTAADQAGIATLAEAVFPPGIPDDSPGSRLEWEPPQWCVRVRDRGGATLSYVGLFHREAMLNGRPVRIGGIGNVKTHPQARNRGLAAVAIGRAIQFFHDPPGLDFALLVCRLALMPYYGRFGFQPFEGTMLIRQKGETCEFTADKPMTLALRDDAPLTGVIDLCGLPW